MSWYLSVPSQREGRRPHTAHHLSELVSGPTTLCLWGNPCINGVNCLKLAADTLLSGDEESCNCSETVTSQFSGDITFSLPGACREMNSLVRLAASEASSFEIKSANSRMYKGSPPPLRTRGCSPCVTVNPGGCNSPGI